MPDSKPPSAEISIESDRRAIILPCEPEQFKDFISGLLGRPQTIARSIRRSFVVKKDDIINLHELLRQRIERQNGGSVVSTSVDIGYTDDSYVTINSIDDFVYYAEIRPLVCTSINIQWTWLVRFSDKEIPEKQDIQIQFSGGDQRVRINRIVIDNILSLDANSSNVNYRISHTDRSWGNDIDALIKGFVENVSTKPSKASEFSHKHSAKLKASSGILLSLISLFTISAVQNYANKLNLASNQLQWSTLPEPDKLAKQIEYLIHSSAPEITISTIFNFLMYAVAILICFFASDTIIDEISRRKPSYVLLTKQTEDLKADVESKTKSEIPKLLGVWASSLVATILGKLAATWLLVNWFK